VNNPKTVQQLLNWACQELKQSSETAKLDAKILLRHICNFSETDLIIKEKEIVEIDTIRAFQQIISKRQQGTPVAYLTGQKEFWSLNFSVTTDTLIPRPETELLVETALNFIPKDKPFEIADLGTGSGAIACAIASERPLANIIATDFSPAALDIAKDNAQRLGYKNIYFLQSNWFENLKDMTFDLIVSNPPYVVSNDINLTQGDVVFEPDLALTPGLDGLKYLTQVIEQSISHLNLEGYLLVEHGYDQEKAVAEIFRDAHHREFGTSTQDIACNNGYQNSVCLRDLNNRPRVTYAQLA